MKIQNNLYDVFKVEFSDGNKYNIKHKDPDDFHNTYQVFLCGNIIDVKIKTGIPSLVGAMEVIVLHHCKLKKKEA